jgi:acetyl esterase/lipase
MKKIGILAAIAAGAALAAATPKPEMKAVLDKLASMHPKPLPTLTAEEARKQPTPADAVKAVLQEKGKSTEPEPVAKVQDLEVEGAEGKLPARIYTSDGTSPMPVIVYFHGGGWVIANRDVYDSTPRALANLTKAIIVSVDYRQGPEHKFPAAHEDSFAAYQWAVDHASTFGGDPRRIAVAGESAGGNLAAAVSLMARDRKAQMPVAQLLVYPIAGYDFDTPSYRENASAKPLDKPGMQWFFQQYLNSPKDAQDPRISLVEADLKGLPPTTIVTAQIDPLRSEGQDLAKALESAGVKVESKNYDGVTHEFFGMAAAVADAKAAEQWAAKELSKSLDGKSSSKPMGRTGSR